MTQQQKDFQSVDEENNLHNDKELEQHSKPMWLTNRYVNNPCCVVIIMQIFFILMLFICLAQQYVNLSEESDRDFLVWDNQRVIDQDLYFLMQDEFQDKKEKIQIPERSEVEYSWSTSIIFECFECDKNILTGENIQILYKIEQSIINLENYKDFCLASYESSECSKESLISITNFIDNPASATDADVQNAIDKITQDAEIFQNYQFLFHNSFSQSQKTSRIFRSVFQFGTPIKVNGQLKLTGEDDDEGQLKEFEDFSKKIMEVSRKEKEPNNIAIIEYSTVIGYLEIGPVAEKDFMYVIGSIIFVWSYLVFHLKSTFLASQSMLNIIISFPITLVFYRGMLMVDYYYFLHFLAVFLVLGVAADDVFVYIDCWRQSNYIPQIANNYERRMAYTFRRASKAMLATSSTTSVCFFATGLSDMMPIAAFGIFAGILIPVNYFLVITYFPAVLMLYEKYFSNICCKKKQNNQQINESIDEINKYQTKKTQINVQKETFIERFLEGPFNSFVYKFRFVIIVIFFIWTGIATWRALLLQPIQEIEQFIPDDFEVIRASKMLSEDFTSSSQDQGQVINVLYFWGVSDIDKEGIGKWENVDAGKVIWDDKFDISPKSNQQWFYDFCVNLKSNVLVLNQEVTCFMVDFKDWVEQQQIEFPVKKSNFFNLLNEFTKSPVGLQYYGQGHLGIMENQLKFVVIEISAVGDPATNYDILNPIYEDWENFKEENQDKAPFGLKVQKQTSIMTWTWMISEKALIQSALNGIFISLLFSFIVLVLTSQNIIISFYSVICITGIVLSVTAVMELKGWQMGVSESISIVILIGLSVDYIVHLANHYIESEQYPDRFTKVQVSLKEIGISILSGAFTTIGAGFFLFFAVVIYFNKFALLIVLTITFSVLYSLFLLCAILHIAGPEGNMGNLKILFCKKEFEEQDKPMSPYEIRQQNNRNLEQKIIKSTDGTRYKGGFKAGQYQGFGELIFPNGSIYKGEFDQGEADGKGIYIWNDGKLYNGNWKKGMRQGYGVTIWPNQSKFCGQYKNDKKHGYGQYLTYDGIQFEGYWKNGKQNDFCKIIMPNKQKILYRYYKNGKEIQKQNYIKSSNF